uniref:Serpentine receptor class gamma n=1 Tax=Rhabditophanes sp. KR3021 TaxID=114890 RepID=A0AC35TND8_9BILA
MYPIQLGLTILFFSYGIVSVILIILTLLLLHKTRNDPDMKSSYFRLQFFLGIIDLLAYLNSNCTNRIPNYGLAHQFFEQLMDNKVDIRFFNALAYYCTYAQYIGVLCLCGNRFSSIISPFRHERVRLLL